MVLEVVQADLDELALFVGHALLYFEFRPGSLTISIMYLFLPWRESLAIRGSWKFSMKSTQRAGLVRAKGLTFFLVVVGHVVAIRGEVDLHVSAETLRLGN